MRAESKKRRFACRLSGAVALGSVLVSLFGFAGLAAGQATLESEVKAAFILNFTKFVAWPAEVFPAPDTPIVICIVGRDPFGRVMDETLRGEAVNARRLVVQRVTEPAGANGCQVVFLGLPPAEAQAVLGGIGHGVLTIGDGEGFIHDGGVIGFVIENRRVRFDINQSAADRAGLRLSSKLLNVARTVAK